MAEILNFPADFYWGASTSAHQVEGGQHNDWAVWEKQNADRLAKNAPDKFGYLPAWPRIKAQAQDPANYISGSAADHYHLYRQDFDLAKSLGFNAYRFSIEWSRVMPAENKFDAQELKHYQKVIQVLRQRNIEPFVTLWHWTLPLWLARRGGWEDKNTADYFASYAAKMARVFKGQVKIYLTVNEPQIYTINSYWRGLWPPQKRNIFAYFKVEKNLIRGHQKAFTAIKEIDPAAQVSIAEGMTYYQAHGKNPVNHLLKKLADRYGNLYFLNRIKNHCDFIGLNHYSRNRIIWGFNKNENKIISDVGRELWPESIYYILKGLKRWGKPIYITENGLADARDEKRAWFIRETLQNVHRAMQEGVPVKGYLHWSLLDNFEWASGFWPRFGLIAVDYKTQARKIRPSALALKNIIQENSLVRNN